MKEELTIKRTNGSDPEFQLLISHLDNELWNELKEDQATYDQFNKVQDIQTVVVIFIDGQPAACGCFKKYDVNTIEVKRMFVEKKYRGKGISKLILDELENWAMESGFQYAVLETSIHFKAARNLYTNSGYTIIENYGQYKGLEESVCMKKTLSEKGGASEFKNLPGIEYFLFEEDFIDKKVRCIPMIVRFKMDKAGIKLKLAEWSRFSVKERIDLAKKACSNEEEIRQYNYYLAGLVKTYTGKDATPLAVDRNPAWAELNVVPDVLNDQLKNFGWQLSPEQWKNQTDLQRFALLKLCKEGHENKNLPKAMREFGLINE
jgi:putative acetyltransferase